jgi:porphobilinogen deaminase
MRTVSRLADGLGTYFSTLSNEGSTWSRVRRAICNSTAERAFLKGLGGGCLVPIAAHAVIENDVMTLKGLVASPDGSEMVRGWKSGGSLEADLIGKRLADELLSQGAHRVLHRNS